VTIGLGVAGGKILAFPIDIDRRPYNTLALPCECVIRQSQCNLAWKSTPWALTRGPNLTQIREGGTVVAPKLENLVKIAAFSSLPAVCRLAWRIVYTNQAEIWRGSMYQFNSRV